MCMMAMAPLMAVASSVVGFMGEQQATNAHNAATAQAHMDARAAAANKYDDEGRRFRYDAKSLKKEAYKAVVKGREAVATAIASSGSSGVSAGSISLNNIIAHERRKTADNVYAADAKFEDMQASYVSKTESYRAEAQSRINSMPFKEGPNPLSLVVGIAGGLAKGFA